jgi:hypothetical protein
VLDAGLALAAGVVGRPGAGWDQTSMTRAGRDSSTRSGRAS